MDLQGKRALVTGGAVRLGRAISLALAARGCHIALHYGRSKREAQATAKDIAAFGVTCTLHQADLEDPQAVQRLAREARKHALGLQILVNNASVFPQASLETAKISDFDESYAVNLLAPALLTQALGLVWKQKRVQARIINIADVGGHLAWPGYLPYSLSKAGLLQLTRASAVALAPTVLVNSVSPGPMMMPAGHSPAQLKRSLARTLLKRLGGAPEIAKAVVLVAESDFMTGSDLGLDGGRSLIG